MIAIKHKVVSRRLWWTGLALVLLFGVWCIVLVAQPTHGLAPDITGAHYRFYDTSNTVTPGSPLAATSTAAQLSMTGQSFRLRTGVTTRDNNIDVTAMQASYTATCVVAGGNAYCSGRDTNGELGDGTRNSTTDFVPVVTSTGLAGKKITNLTSNSLGNNFIWACAVADGQLYCWGNNNYGGLGTGQTGTQLVDSTVPVAGVMDGSLTGKLIDRLAAGQGHICGVTTDYKGFCWGTGSNGRLGDNTGQQRYKPTEIYMGDVLAGKQITDITAGSAHGCAVASGAVYCWGSNSLGQLGNNSTTQSLAPTPVDTTGVLAGKTMTRVIAILNSTCALDSNGKMYCWGQNSASVFGDNTGNASLVPVASDMSLVTGGALSSISGAEGNACGIGVADNQMYCWGTNGGGTTGRGLASGTTMRPTQVTSNGFLSGKTVTSVSSGRGTSCGITNLKEAFCMGYNPNGNLATGNTTNQLNPQPVSTLNFVPSQGFTVATNTLGSRLEFARKTAGTCAAQTGFSPVTTTSDIAWSVNGAVSSGSAITTSANDPYNGSNVVAQTYVSDSSSFNNPNVIGPGKSGLWDFSLKDNSGLLNTSYCLRLAQSNGTSYGSYIAYPEIKTAQGVLSVGIVDGSDNPIVSPSVALPSTVVSTSCQTVSGTLGTPSQKIRVGNDTNNAGWSISIAATAGATAKWQHDSQSYSYDYNDGSGSPPGCVSGLDGDGIAGQLTINPSAAGSTVTPLSGCTTTAITKGTSQAFVQGVTDAITLVSASSGADLHCRWDITGIGVTQVIPASQPSGNYSIDMTLTVLAQ